MLNLTTLEITTIAIQPADASLFVDGVEDSALLRSTLTWSPDGSQLAWGEVHYPSYATETNRLVVFDFGQGDTTVLVTNLPDQAGVPQPVAPEWGSSGLAFASYEFDPDTATFSMNMLVYSAQDGSLISSTPIPDSETQFLGDYLWVSSSGKEEIAVQYKPDGNWELLDPLTGTLHPALSVPELYNPLVPDSAGVTFTHYPDAEWPNFYSWTIVYPNGQQIDGPNRVSDAARVTLAPDGQTLAQVSTDGLLSFLSPDGQVIEGPDLEDNFATLFWGPTAWRIDQPAACGRALSPRLVIGSIGILSPNTTPNNVRSEPASGEVIGQLQPGDNFSVLAGPECVNDMYWWQVDNGNGLVGWTAEADSSNYWLEPGIG